MSASWKDVIDNKRKPSFSGLHAYDSSSTYYANYKCINCGKEDNLQIAKGVLAPKVAKCPKCECMTMVKVNK